MSRDAAILLSSSWYALNTSGPGEGTSDTRTSSGDEEDAWRTVRGENSQGLSWSTRASCGSRAGWGKSCTWEFKGWLVLIVTGFSVLAREGSLLGDLLMRGISEVDLDARSIPQSILKGHEGTGTVLDPRHIWPKNPNLWLYSSQTQACKYGNGTKRKLWTLDIRRPESPPQSLIKNWSIPRAMVVQYQEGSSETKI